MPPLVVPATVRATLVWTLAGAEYAVNVLHYIVPAAQVVNGTTASDFASEVSGAFATALLGTELNNDVDLARVTVRDIRTASLPEFSSPVVGAAGTDSEVLLPPGTSLVVTLRTNKAGRRYRGRVYIPGWAESANGASGTATAAAVSAAESFIFNLTQVSIQGNGWNLGVMSTVDLDTNQVVSVEVRDNIWDTQRRRAYPGI